MNITRTLEQFWKHQKSSALSGPIQLDINPTNKCTDECVFCFNKADRESNEDDFKADHVCSVIEHLVENTALMHIKVSGFGDPMLNNDIWDIFRYTRELGLVNSLNTNGVGLKRRINDLLTSVDSVRFSVDAWGEKQFQLSHGVKGFSKRINDIQFLAEERDIRQADLIIGIHYVVLPDNYMGLKHIVEWAKDIGLDYVDISFDKFNPAFLGKWSSTSISNAQQEIRNIKRYITHKFNIIFPARMTESAVELDLFRKEREMTKMCWQVPLRHYITPSGEYGACNAFDSQPIKKLIFGNIYRDKIDSILENSQRDHSPINTINDCRYCVIPHGIFNDLCSIIKHAVESNYTIIHDSNYLSE